MRRRDFVIGVAGATTWPLAAHAEQFVGMKRVGVLLLFGADDPEGQVRAKAFEPELHRLASKSGYSIQIEYRFAAGDFERMRTLAGELIELPADVIVTTGLSAIMAAQQNDHTTPIVFANIPNPVEQGLIGSLSHPDLNMTGITGLDYPAIIGKWLELLKAIAPQLVRVGILFNPDAYFSYLPPPPGSYWFRHLEAVASAFAVEPIAVPVHDLIEMQDALAAFAQEPGSGLLVATDIFTMGHYLNIISLAFQHRLPACYPYPFFSTGGGLMSYGPNGAEAFRQAASYVDRILCGANPRDLPIRRPTTLELTINLKTAKALGLSVPPLMLARADEVIE
jgi:putative ABC transport system substrate-binding protein